MMTDPKELRAAILGTLQRTFAQAHIVTTKELEAALGHAAGNIAQWVFLEYVIAPQEKSDDTTKDM